MESVYRQGPVGHTSQKREFIPSDVSKSKLAVRQDINSSQSPESIRTATVEPATKVQVPQASLAPETKESAQRVVELPRTQPPTETHHPPEVHPEKVIVSRFVAYSSCPRNQILAKNLRHLPVMTSYNGFLV
jgi:hypothetical protein